MSSLPQSYSQPRLSPPALGLLVGLLTGIADWLILANDWGHSQSGMWSLPPFVWASLIWTSVTLCCLAGVVFSSPRLGRLRGVAMVVAGPGMLLLSRGATPFREKTGLSTVGVLLAWLVATLIFSIPFALLPMKAPRFRPVWIAGTIVSAVILISLAADSDVWPWRSKELSSSIGGGQKNVALIFLDTLRYDDALGGEHPAMPSLRAFASRATSFDNAWAPVPWTLPSHFSVLTGIDPWRLPLEAESSSFHYQGLMLAQVLRAQGYDTAAILANPLLGNPDFSRGYGQFTYSRASGVCRSWAGELLNRSFVHGGPRSSLCGWLIASEVTARALRFVARASRPYFLTLNYMDAHYPYYVPPQCRSASFQFMGRGEREAYRRSTPATPARPVLLQHAHEQYRTAVGCMDRSLGTLLAALERDPNTIVVILGDHGEQFGEHGLIEHGNSVYRQVLHVPLVIRTPGDAAAHVTTSLSISDVHPSILTAIGMIRIGSRLLIDEDRLRRPVVSTYAALVGGKAESGFSVTRGEYHYILWRDGREALFNDATDPIESLPIPLRSGTGAAAIAGSLKGLATRAAASGQRSNEFKALGYLQ